MSCLAAHSSVPVDTMALPVGGSGLKEDCVLLAAERPCVGGWCWERKLPETCVVGATCCHIAHPKRVCERELGGNRSFFNLSYNLMLKILLFSEAAATWEMNKQSLQ